MSANYTPNLGEYTELTPFRYWCQKVLPLVYDDSLSYYELLCKVVDYLNKTMQDVETLHTDVTALHSAFENLQTYVNHYFDNLDVQTAINNKLDDMAESGELLNIVKPSVVSEVDSWLTANITNPTNPVVDTSLSVTGAAADSATVGKYFQNLDSLYDGSVHVTDFENGNVDISGSKLVYSANKNRVRTKNGTFLSLKAGTTIRLKDYEKYSMLVLWYDQNWRIGWVNHEFCVPRDGEFAINITTKDDNVALSVEEAYGQLVIEADSCVINGFNLIRGNTNNSGRVVYADYSAVTKEIIHYKAGSCFFPNTKSGTEQWIIQRNYYDDKGAYLSSQYAESNKPFMLDKDAYIRLRFKHLKGSSEQTTSYSNLANGFTVAYNSDDVPTPVTSYSFGGFSSYQPHMILDATIKPVSAYPSSAAATIVTPNRKTVGIDFSLGTPVDMVKYLNNMYHYNLIDKLDYIVVTHYHSDHTGGLPALVNTYGVNIDGAVAFLPALLTTANTANLTVEDREDALAQQTAILNLLHDHNCTIINPAENSVYNIDGVVVQFSNTDYSPYNTSGSAYYTDKYNNYSMVVQTVNHGYTVTYTGDIQKLALQNLAKKLMKADVMTSPHHGWLVNSDGLIPDFINTVSPDVVIAENGSEQKPGGVGDMDGTGAPMTDWCDKNGVPNYATYENGTINIDYADGQAKFVRPVIRHVKTK
mgnify:CR=1 FL=1